MKIEHDRRLRVRQIAAGIGIALLLGAVLYATLATFYYQTKPFSFYLVHVLATLVLAPVFWILGLRPTNALKVAAVVAMLLILLLIVAAILATFYYHFQST